MPVYHYCVHAGIPKTTSSWLSNFTLNKHLRPCTPRALFGLARETACSFQRVTHTVRIRISKGDRPPHTRTIYSGGRCALFHYLELERGQKIGKMGRLQHTSYIYIRPHDYNICRPHKAPQAPGGGGGSVSEVQRKEAVCRTILSAQHGHTCTAVYHTRSSYFGRTY